MEKLNLPFFYNLGAKLYPLARARLETYWAGNFMYLASDARIFVQNVLDQVEVTIAQPEGRALLAAIDKCVAWDVPNLNVPPTGAELADATNLLARANAFEAVIIAELQSLPTYHAMRKGIYSTSFLIEQAANMFPASVRSKLPPAVISEIEECARCLAFDNSTACGFHMMRATELVMHEYYLRVCKPKPKPSARLKSWNDYVIAFGKVPQAKKVGAMIDLMRAQDRNLVMHPDLILQPDDAFKFFEMGQGVIIVMADGLPAAKVKKAAKA